MENFLSSEYHNLQAADPSLQTQLNIHQTLNVTLNTCTILIKGSKWSDNTVDSGTISLEIQIHKNYQSLESIYLNHWIPS